MAVLTAVALRIVWVACVNVDPTDGRFDDSVFYHNVARLLAMGVGYADPWGRGPTAQWLPAYPAALAVLYKAFGVHLALAKALNIACAAVTVALVYILARRLFDQRVAYLGALILAFFPGQIYFSTLVMTETMFAMVFVLVLLLALVWTVERPEARWWQVLLIGVLVGAAAMVRAEGAFLACVLAALWALTVRPWRRMVRYAAILAIGAALALTPWTVRNAIELHSFIPLRPNPVGPISAALDPDFEGQRIRGVNEPRTLAEGLRERITQPWQIPISVSEKVQRVYRNDADGIRYIQNTPTWRYAGDFERTLTEDEAGRWRGLANYYFFAVGAAALVAAALCLAQRNRASLVLIVAALGWTLLFGFIKPQTRYHFPVGPLMAVFAAGFLLAVWDWVAVVRRRPPMQAGRERASPAGTEQPTDGAS